MVDLLEDAYLLSIGMCRGVKEGERWWGLRSFEH